MTTARGPQKNEKRNVLDSTACRQIVGREARLLVSQLAWLILELRGGARPRELKRSTDYRLGKRG